MLRGKADVSHNVLRLKSAALFGFFPLMARHEITTLREHAITPTTRCAADASSRLRFVFAH